MNSIRPISRGLFAVMGLALFLLKFNLDRLVLRSPSWSISNYLYFLPGTLTLSNTQYSPGLLALAVPFVAVGVWLTLGRLRELGWHPALVALFFVPFVNLLFFLVLCIVPARTVTDFPPPLLRGFLPQSRWGGAAMGVLFSVPPALLLSILLIAGWERYALGLFIGVPFLCGFFAAWLHGAREPRWLAESIAVGALSTIVLGLVMFGLAVEGVICLAMAAPFALVLGCLGGAVGHLMRRAPTRPRAAGAWLIALPLALAVEHAATPRPESQSVTTAINIAATPEVVWENVIRFRELREPQEWYFRTGIAYPMRARIEGNGPGAVRHCEFSTGAFVEPITVWEPQRLLRFGVNSSPPPMHEWTPYGRLNNVPHLRGFFEATQGEFRLERTDAGHTRLFGTTWYRHRIWPAPYWRLWSDAIVTRIHKRVLEHIRERSTTLS
jgi:hypothetical protein